MGLLFDAGDDTYHPSLVTGGYDIGPHRVLFPAGMQYDPTFVYARFGEPYEALNGENGVVRVEGPREELAAFLADFEAAHTPDEEGVTACGT